MAHIEIRFSGNRWNNVVRVPWDRVQYPHSLAALWSGRPLRRKLSNCNFRSVDTHHYSGDSGRNRFVRFAAYL